MFYKRNDQFYIYHEDLQNPENGVAYFGPFPEEELEERLHDAYADLLAGVGNLDGEILEDREAEKMYINPPEFWYEQLKEIENA